MSEQTNEVAFDYLEYTARTLKVVQVIAIGFALAQLILITAYA
jgi:hypothetical protein